MSRKARFACRTMLTVVIIECITLTPGAALQDRSRKDPQVQELFDFFADYDRAMSAKDMELLATMYAEDVTVFEAGRVDEGWRAYRDEHLAGELKAYAHLQFRHKDLSIKLLGDNAAYATGVYEIRYILDEPILEIGLVTHIIQKKDGRWKIQHTQSIPRRRLRG